jgi:hypothetical protein
MVQLSGVEERMRTRQIAAIILVIGACCWPASGAERDFQAVVGAIEAHLGVHHTHIPMMGFAKLFVKASAPSGVHDFELATFEDLRYSADKFRDFRDVVSDALGESWRSMVQVQAPSRKEYTGIFIKGQAGKFRMLIATIEAEEATVVEVQISPSQWLAWLGNPATMGHRVGGNGEREDCCGEE